MRKNQNKRNSERHFGKEMKSKKEENAMKIIGIALHKDEINIFSAERAVEVQCPWLVRRELILNSSDLEFASVPLKERLTRKSGKHREIVSSAVDNAT